MTNQIARFGFGCFWDKDDNVFKDSEKVFCQNNFWIRNNYQKVRHQVAEAIKNRHFHIPGEKATCWSAVTRSIIFRTFFSHGRMIYDLAWIWTLPGESVWTDRPLSARYCCGTATGSGGISCGDTRYIYSHVIALPNKTTWLHQGSWTS